MLLPVSNYKKSAGGVFSPSDISDLELWLDMSDTGTITHTANAVSQVDDKSGNANHATQGTGSAQPTTGLTIGSLNAIEFDGSTDWLNIPDNLLNNTACTICLVFYPHTTDSDQIFANRGTGSNNDRAYGGNQWTNLGNSTLSRTTPVANETIRQVSWVDGAAGSRTQYLLVNEDSIVSSAVTRAEPNSNFTLGSYDDGFNGFYDGLLGEVIVYSKDLSPTERGNIMTYFDRWTAVDNIVDGSDNVVDGSDNVIDG